MTPWPSTVGLAIMVAYWLLVILFILFGLGASMVATARARTAHHGFPMIGVVLGGVTPALLGDGAATQLHPGWALILSAGAVIFSLWWLHNMAKREP